MRPKRLRPCLHDWNDVLRSHPQIPLPLPPPNKSPAPSQTEKLLGRKKSSSTCCEWVILGIRVNSSERHGPYAGRRFRVDRYPQTRRRRRPRQDISGATRWSRAYPASLGAQHSPLFPENFLRWGVLPVLSRSAYLNLYAYTSSRFKKLMLAGGGETPDTPW